MSLSRRRFLRAGTLVALAASVPLKELFAETLSQPGAKRGASLPVRSYPDAFTRLNRETFARYVNTTFSLNHGDTRAVVKLIEVNDYTPEAMKRSAKTTGRECFAALFLGSSNEHLRQETYAVAHKSLGSFDLLLVPVGKSKQGLYYEAVFNRLV
jgi:hypothetical protein